MPINIDSLCLLLLSSSDFLSAILHAVYLSAQAAFVNDGFHHLKGICPILFQSIDLL